MATIPYFALGPTFVTGIIGLLHGPDKTVPTPKEDWHDAKVDVIIPAYQAESEIDLCLASIKKQTFQPRRILIIDDGSQDNTKLFAESICKRLEMNNVTIIRREKSIGKTPSLQEAAYNSDSDVEFVLDSDTILVSENYIARTVEELYKGVGIASACGTILPLLEKTRSQLLANPVVGPQLKAHFKEHPEAGYYVVNSTAHRFGRFTTNLYRDALYKFLQRFIYHAEMVFFGSIINPVGCAVAYRRKYIKDVFDQSKDILGSDLTTSEDIYIGFALTNQGYRNIQLQDVTASTLEPSFTRLPRQIFMWSSAFLQSCYYFKHLLFTPFKIFTKLTYRHRYREQEKIHEKQRKIKEAYRQAFGAEKTEKFGRPIGWFIFTNMFEKIAFPTIFLIFLIGGYWEGFWVALVVESLTSSSIFAVVSEGERIKMFFKGFITSPIRYTFLMYDFLVFIWFLLDAFVRKNRKWRK